MDFHIKGYIRLCHPDLIIDFLVPERGRGLDKPYPLPQLGIKAQALRFLDFLVENSMKFKINDLNLNLPHPAAFAIHKLIISSRRPREEKKVKEREEAVRVIKSLIAKREEETINRLFNSMPRKWRTKVIRSLEESKAKEILAFLA